VQVLRPNIININKTAGGPQVNEGVYQQQGISAYGVDMQGEFIPLWSVVEKMRTGVGSED